MGSRQDVQERRTVSLSYCGVCFIANIVDKPAPITANKPNEPQVRVVRLASRLERETGSELNISPLIDMMFILLIFFMVSTTFVKDMKIDIERPGAL